MNFYNKSLFLFNAKHNIELNRQLEKGSLCTTVEFLDETSAWWKVLVAGLARLWWKVLLSWSWAFLASGAWRSIEQINYSQVFLLILIKTYGGGGGGGQTGHGGGGGGLN